MNNETSKVKISCYVKSDALQNDMYNLFSDSVKSFSSI